MSSPNYLNQLTNRPRATLWRDRAFVLFWLARSVSILGSTITAVLLPILVFQLTGSALQTSLIAVLEVIPYLVFGLFAGALADRVDRRRMMVASDLINTALLGSIPLAAALQVLTLPQIYVVSFLSAVAFVWFDAANFGALPALVGSERIVEANSALWSTSTIIAILGPAIGGAVAAVSGTANAISLDSLSYLFSAVVLSLVPGFFTGARKAELDASPIVRRTLDDIRTGLEFLWQQPLVRTLTLLGFGLSFTTGAVTGLLVVYGVRALGLTDNDPRLGLLYTAGALGALASSLLLPWLTRRFQIGRITLIALFACVGILIALVLAPNFISGLVIYALWDAASTLVIINGISLRQVVTPEPLQSRVNATARMIAWGGTPFGAALGGILAEGLPIRTAYLIVALGVGLSALLGWFSPLREPKGKA